MIDKDNEIVTSAAPPDADGWDDVDSMFSADANAKLKAIAIAACERDRCAQIVSGEIERGRLRDIPANAGVMIILHRIHAAISNG